MKKNLFRTNFSLKKYKNLVNQINQIEDNLKSLELAKNWNEDLENKINKILGNAPETEKNFKTW